MEVDATVVRIDEGIDPLGDAAAPTVRDVQGNGPTGFGVRLLAEVVADYARG